jgi:hypothetical protein
MTSLDDSANFKGVEGGRVVSPSFFNKHPVLYLTTGLVGLLGVLLPLIFSFKFSGGNAYDFSSPESIGYSPGSASVGWWTLAITMFFFILFSITHKELFTMVAAFVLVAGFIVGYLGSAIETSGNSKALKNWFASSEGLTLSPKQYQGYGHSLQKIANGGTFSLVDEDDSKVEGVFVEENKGQYVFTRLVEG